MIVRGAIRTGKHRNVPANTISTALLVLLSSNADAADINQRPVEIARESRNSIGGDCVYKFKSIGISARPERLSAACRRVAKPVRQSTLAAVSYRVFGYPNSQPSGLAAFSDGKPLSVLLTNYGAPNVGYPSYYCKTSGGTRAKPIALQYGNALCGFYAFGFNGLKFSQSAIGMEFVAAENFTPIANGTEYWFYATPNGLTANQITASLTGNAVFSLGVVNALGEIDRGSGYVDGIYLDVPLSDLGMHPGSGAKATIVVERGGVASVQLTSAGKDYTPGSVLTAPDGYLGAAGTGFQVPVATINGIGGSITSGYTGQISLINSAYGGGPVAIRNAGALGPGYDFNLPATAGQPGQYLASNGPGNLQTWKSVNAISVGGYVDNVDFNRADIDTPITVSLPADVKSYRIENVIIANASSSLRNSKIGLFTEKNGGGASVVDRDAAIVVETAESNTKNNTQALLVNDRETTSYNVGTLYARVLVPQGYPSTATIIVFVMPLP
jgi:hypothetical protein